MSKPRKRFTPDFYVRMKENNQSYCPRCETVVKNEMFRVSFCIECSKAVGREQYARTKEVYARRYRDKRETSGYYVYKFLNDEGNIIYIGKSIRIKSRIAQHFNSGGHLSDECYNNVSSVFYCQFKTKIDMDIYEMYLIDKIRPQYNTVFSSDYDKPSTLILPELHWSEYQEVI